MGKGENDVVIALDVGGTVVKGEVVSSEGNVIGKVLEVKSPSDQPAETIINTLKDLLRRLQDRAVKDGHSPKACVVGFPWPFDYERGISQIKHKFASLYGKNLKKPLEELVGVPVYFLNDADAFALGVSREYPSEKRILAITLGTGLGSGFLVDGKLAIGKEGVPPHGEIWNTPYKGKILEEFVSKRALSRSYRMHGGSEKDEVEDIAEKARAGDSAAKAAFEKFTQDLGEGLAVAAAPFHPTRIVIGGQISNAFDLFGKKAERIFGKKARYKALFSKARGKNLALIGAADYAIISG
ncbi:ROK family protein [Candidatus Roizmanbacteria bacterium]|nr:ROK family protein [Candidatus Roizmanbacteria bacterium]